MGPVIKRPFAIGMLLTSAALVMTAGCIEQPQRNQAHSYPEYKAMALGLPFGEAEEEGSGGDGDFGPTSGAVTVTSADDVSAGKVADGGSIKGIVKFAGDPIRRG